MIHKIKSFLLENQHKIRAIGKAASGILEAGQEFSERQSLWGIANIGAKTAANIFDIYNEFTVPNFKYEIPATYHFFLKSLFPEIQTVTRDEYGEGYIIYRGNQYTVVSCFDNPGVSAYGSASNNEYANACYLKGDINRFHQDITDRLSKMGSFLSFDCASNLITKSELKFTHDNASAQEIAEELQIWKQHNEGYSILFHGPPGTGKSTMARTIAKLLGFAVNVENLNTMNLKCARVCFMLKNIKNSVCILDDLDRCIMPVKDLLWLLEELKANQIIVLATVNNLAKMDQAITRPGRFDKVVQINKMEPTIILQMLENDSEAFELLKDQTVASISEFIRRKRVLGREQAIQSIDDILLRGKLIDLDYQNLTVIPSNDELEDLD